MARLWGYMANRPDGVADALPFERRFLSCPEIQARALGLGFYQASEVLHIKRPVHSQHLTILNDVLQGVRSDCVLIHLRQATVGDFRSENIHPFRFQSWLFAHNGTLNHFDQLRPYLLEQIPDFLRRGIRGQTDSEHLMMLLLTEIHAESQLETFDPSAERICRSVSSALNLLDNWYLAHSYSAPRFGFMLTNGRMLLAARRGAPMFWVRRHEGHNFSRRGSTPPPLLSTTSKRPSFIGHQDPLLRKVPPSTPAQSLLRYVMVLSAGPGEELGLGTGEHGYHQLNENRMLFVDRALEAQELPFDDSKAQ